MPNLLAMGPDESPDILPGIKKPSKKELEKLGKFVGKNLLGMQDAPPDSPVSMPDVAPTTPSGFPMAPPQPEIVQQEEPMDLSPDPNDFIDVNAPDELPPAAQEEATDTSDIENVIQDLQASGLEPLPEELSPETPDAPMSELQRKMAELRGLPEFQAQQKSIDDLKRYAQEMETSQTQENPWLKPLLALADSEYGSKLMAGYTPHDNKQLQEMFLKYNEAANRRQGELNKALLYGAKNQSPTGQLSQVRANRQVAMAGESFDRDKIMNVLTSTRNNLDRALSMIHGKTPITATNLAILQKDIANATAPGGAATEGVVHRETIEPLAAMLNRVQQKFGNVKDLRKADPQTFAQLQMLIEQVREDYRMAAKNRIDEIAINYSNIPDENMQKTLSQKIERLHKSWEELPHGKQSSPSREDKIRKLREEIKAAEGGR